MDKGARLKLVAAYQRSRTRITELNQAPEVLGVNMTDLILDPFTRVLIEGSQPADAIKLWSRYSHGSYDLVLNLNRFGKFHSVSAYDRVTFSAKWTLDAELCLRLAKDVTLALGGVNLFDVRPDKWGQTDDSLVGAGKVIQYSQYAPFGYNGASYYLRLGVNF
jgi:iron complex outermembrane receptor protein